MKYELPYILVAYKKCVIDDRYRRYEDADFQCLYCSKETLIKNLKRYIDYDEIFIFREGICLYEGYIRSYPLEDRQEYNEEKQGEWIKEIEEIIKEAKKGKI